MSTDDTLPLFSWLTKLWLGAAIVELDGAAALASQDRLRDHEEDHDHQQLG